MSNLFQIGALDACGGLLPLVKVIRKGLFWILYLIMPIVLILLVTIDIAKAVIASDEKEVKAAQSRLIKRIIYAALIFFVPMLVGVVMNLVAAGGEVAEDQTVDTVNWKNCWVEMNS